MVNVQVHELYGLEGTNMELQVRLAYETAEILEMLKKIYETENGVSFSKGSVVSKAVIDNYALWQEMDWNFIREVPLTVESNDNITAGALRPKLQISTAVNNKLQELQELIKVSVGAQYVKMGAAIKFVLRLALYEYQSDTKQTVETIVSGTLTEYLERDIDDNVKKVLSEYTQELLLNLEKDDLI